MRAMPSPTEVITPSCASTTGASKLAMRCFRMSPISSLRMAMVVGSSVVMRVLRWEGAACASHQHHLELLQPRTDAGVDDPVTDADDQPAEDGRILAALCLHVRAELLAEGTSDASPERVVHWDGGDHLGAYHPAVAVGEEVVR